jgi:Molecular chaperone (small heat shock protein)
MANISRFNPFPRTFEPMSDPFETLMRRMWQPVKWGQEGPMDIRIDVQENDKVYTVRAEMPGLKKEDIKVEIVGDTVSISAESKREEEVKEKGQIVRSERYYGSLYRSFSLGTEIDEAGASAKYVDGVLELTLPKKEGVSTKQINVQ